MKKTYKNPTMVVVKIQARHQMMADSFTKADYDGSQTIGGRDFDFDFDDEE